MYKNKKILCVIPARAGSRGLPGKNVKMFAGRPLIAWTIRQALASAYLDKVIVSTDSRRIARIARRYKAEVPFVRPRSLATSSAKIFDVIRHALGHLSAQGERFDIVVMLQATSPLRTPADIDNAIRLLFRKKGKAVISACLSEHHPLWAFTLTAGGKIGNLPQIKRSNRNRQELPLFYRPNGAVYVAFTESLLKDKGFICAETFVYLMPFARSVDIDTRLDFDLALLLKNKRKIS